MQKRDIKTENFQSSPKTKYFVACQMCRRSQSAGPPLPFPPPPRAPPPPFLPRFRRRLRARSARPCPCALGVERIAICPRGRGAGGARVRCFAALRESPCVGFPSARPALRSNPAALPLGFKVAPYPPPACSRNTSRPPLRLVSAPLRPSPPTTNTPCISSATSGAAVAR